MDSIIHDVQSLYEVALAQLYNNVQRSLCDACVSSDVQETVEREFTCGPYTRVFSGLTTTSQQMAYFKQHFHFVVCSFCNKIIYMTCVHIGSCQGCIGNMPKGQRFRNKASACRGRGELHVYSSAGDPTDIVEG